MTHKPRKHKGRPGKAQGKKPDSAPSAPVPPPPVVPTGDEKQQGDNANRPVTQQNNSERKPMTYFEIIYLVLTAGLLATTVVLACMASDQLRSIKSQIGLAQGQLDQAKVASEQTDETIAQMRLQQRPWVGVEKTATDEIKDKITGWITFKNFGSNPAFVYNTRIIAVPYAMDDGDLAQLTEVHPDQPEKDFAQMVIPPGQAFSGALPSEMVLFTKTVSERPLPSDYTKEVVEGKRPYYVVGAIFYRDANDTKHVTGFCLVYDAKLKQLRQYEKYNYMQ